MTLKCYSCQKSSATFIQHFYLTGQLQYDNLKLMETIPMEHYCKECCDKLPYEKRVLFLKKGKRCQECRITLVDAHKPVCGECINSKIENRINLVSKCKICDIQRANRWNREGIYEICNFCYDQLDENKLKNYRIEKELCFICKKTASKYGLTLNNLTHCAKCFKEDMSLVNKEKYISKMRYPCIICKVKNASYGEKIREYCSECYKGIEHKEGIEAQGKTKCSECLETFDCKYRYISNKKKVCNDCYFKNDNKELFEKFKYLCFNCKTITATYKSCLYKERYCSGCFHKLSEDIKEQYNETSTKKCILCNIQKASYLNNDSNQKEICKKCLDVLPDNIKKQYKNTDKQCSECNIYRPRYGYLDDFGKTHAVLCAECFQKSDNKENYINIKTYQKCKFCSNTDAKYHKVGDKPNICYSCFQKEIPDYEKTEYEYLYNKKCITSEYCGGKSANPKYEGYCAFCYAHLFPDKKQSIRYKTDEMKVVDYLRLHLPDPINKSFIHDRPIDKLCSKKRPDIFIDCLTHCIIIEVDEDQHKGYDTSCEISRLNQLYIDNGCMRFYMIRYNPHKFYKGKILQKVDTRIRLKTLKQTIIDCLFGVPEEEVELKYLYYNE